MPCTLPDGLVSGRLRSPCASIQSTPPGRPAAAAMPESVPIATEWSPPRTSGVAPARRPRRRPPSASRAHASRISVEVAGPLVADRERLGLVRDDVAAVAGDDADRGQPLLEARVADRGRAHVDAAPALAEVERRADDGDGPGARHGRAAYPGAAPCGAVAAARWRGPDSNRRHLGFQPSALPAELPRRGISVAMPAAGRISRAHAAEGRLAGRGVELSWSGSR